MTRPPAKAFPGGGSRHQARFDYDPIATLLGEVMLGHESALLHFVIIGLLPYTSIHAILSLFPAPRGISGAGEGK